VEDAQRVPGRAEPDGQEHVADLADRGVGQHLLDVVVGAADDRPDQQGDHADQGDDQPPGLGEVVDRVAAGDQVDPGGDHRRRVDQGRDRGRALHGVGEPGLQRELAGLAARAQEQQHADRDEHARAELPGPLEDLRVLDGAQVGPQQEDRQGQADVADPVHQERLLGGRGRGRAVLVEADQQVGRQADALPAQVEHHEVVADDQHQHGRDEQVQLGEEPPARPVVAGLGVVVVVAARVRGHVADRVDVDQRADPGDQQDEHQRQRVDPQPEVDGQPVDGHPVEQVHLAGALRGGQGQGGEEDGQAEHERRDDGEHAQPVPPGVGPPAGQEQHQRAGGRQHEQQPGQRRDAGGGGDLGQLGGLRGDGGQHRLWWGTGGTGELLRIST
jgi:hypothetical protein